MGWDQRWVRRQCQSVVAERAAVVAALVLLAPPSVAVANTGTPMMWMSAAHLVLGNLLIGLGESLIIARLLRARVLRCVWVMVFANYVSAWIGKALLPVVHEAGIRACGDATIETIGTRLGIMALLYFAATLAIEWPFVWFAAARGSRTPGRTACACIAANALSYAILAALYYWVSGPTLLTGVTRRPVADFAQRADDVWVYYIDEATDRLAKVRPDGTRREVLDRTLPPYSVEGSRSDWLSGGFLASRDEGDGTFTLRSSTGTGHPSTLAELDIVYGPARGTPAASTRELSQTSGDWIPETFRWTFSMRAPDDRRTVQAGFWPIEGLYVDDHGTQLVWVAWETPFESWACRSPTELASGLVVFQLGESQLVGLDPTARSIGLLARGRCPVVVTEDPVH